MPIGPVFRFEMLTASRRLRFYVLRALYGFLAFLMIWSAYEPLSWRSAQGLVGHHEMARFANEVFEGYSYLQFWTILLLTPILTAGAIAEEYQRKTLHYLLASSLTSREIILGKLGSRLLQLAIFVVAGLPILSLLSLFGGVEPLLVLAVVGGSITTAFFVAALSILISVHVERPRDAILATYAAGFAWLFGGIFLLEMARGPTWNVIWAVIRAVAQLLSPVAWIEVASSPAGLLYASWTRFGGRAPSALLQRFELMMLSQALFGLVILGLAAWRLRPVASHRFGRPRRDWHWLFGRIAERLRRRAKARRVETGEDVPPVSSRLTTSLEFLARYRRKRSCGDDPILWKEMNRASLRGVARFLIVGGFLVFGAIPLLWQFLNEFPPALNEALVYGWFPDSIAAKVENVAERMRIYNLWSDPQYRYRHSFKQFVDGCGIFLMVLSGLGAALSAAASVTGEKEQDTWISLISTPLEGREVLRGKALGALWVVRPFWMTALVVWLAGVVVGSLHPISAAVLVPASWIYLRFAATLGLWCSLFARTTIRAQILAILGLVALNGGYLAAGLVFTLLPPNERPDPGPIVFVGVAPLILDVATLSPLDLHDLAVTGEVAGKWFAGRRLDWRAMSTIPASLALYLGLAYWVGRSARRRLDRLVDRPARRPAVP